MLAHRLSVRLNDRSYPVYIGSDLVSSFAPVCLELHLPQSLVIITDAHIARLHAQPLVKNLTHHGFQVQVLTIPAGEQQKNIRRANTLYTELLKRGIDRKSGIIALGGGVIGDLAGFIAATYQRGIKLIQVPTTLLAQVDSAIGGKVGINHRLGKNMIGAFYQPALVWEDSSYLQTLPLREVLCGLGEIVKYGIIRDPELFSYLETHVDLVLHCLPENILHVQSRCASIKAQIVSEDEFEQDVRIILNCGHTIGHALESAGNYRILKHGEAVLFGIIAESYIANRMGVLGRNEFGRIANLISSIPLKAKLLKSIRTRDIMPALQRDKKRIGKKVRFVLPKKIGETVVVDEVDEQIIRESLQFLYKQRN